MGEHPKRAPKRSSAANGKQWEACMACLSDVPQNHRNDFCKNLFSSTGIAKINTFPVFILHDHRNDHKIVVVVLKNRFRLPTIEIAFSPVSSIRIAETTGVTAIVFFFHFFFGEFHFFWFRGQNSLFLKALPVEKMMKKSEFSVKKSEKFTFFWKKVEKKKWIRNLKKTLWSRRSRMVNRDVRFAEFGHIQQPGVHISNSCWLFVIF